MKFSIPYIKPNSSLPLSPCQSHPNSSTPISFPALEAYFMLIVLSYYLQQQRAFGADDEFEVLFTASEAQLAANP